MFTLKNTLRRGPGFLRFAFGPAHMTPLVGNWAGGRRDGVGYYDRWTGRFVLRDRLGAGRPSVALKFGPAHMDPLAGVWFG